MNRWIDDGEYWKKKGRLHHKGGGKYIVSIKKTAISVSQLDSLDHAKEDKIGAT